MSVRWLPLISAVCHWFVVVLWSVRGVVRPHFGAGLALVRHLRRRHRGSAALMLNVGRLGDEGADYYLSQVVSGVEDHYTGSGEAPGYWLGSASEALGSSASSTPTISPLCSMAATPCRASRSAHSGASSSGIVTLGRGAERRAGDALVVSCPCRPLDPNPPQEHLDLAARCSCGSSPTDRQCAWATQGRPCPVDGAHAVAAQ